MTDCTLISGFYWAAGKCLFGITVTAGIIAIGAVFYVGAYFLDRMRK